MKQAVAGCRPFLQPDTLVVSIDAGVRADTVAGWLGASEAPHTRLERCMPNTPALIGEGASGPIALPGVSAHDKVVAAQLPQAADALEIRQPALLSPAPHPSYQIG